MLTEVVKTLNQGQIFIKALITVVNNNVFTLEKLLSLLPEYVVPYMIHLLAHDPDFTRSQDVDQLRDIKE